MTCNYDWQMSSGWGTMLLSCRISSHTKISLGHRAVTAWGQRSHSYTPFLSYSISSRCRKWITQANKFFLRTNSLNHLCIVGNYAARARQNYFFTNSIGKAFTKLGNIFREKFLKKEIHILFFTFGRKFGFFPHTPSTPSLQPVQIFSSKLISI